MKVDTMRFSFVFSLALLLLVACAADAKPEDAVSDYLTARVAGDADALRGLACAAWEEEAVLQAETFQALDARLEGLACQQTSRNGDAAVISCTGTIIITYTGENSEQPVAGAFSVVKEDDEWKVCGEAAP